MEATTNQTSSSFFFSFSSIIYYFQFKKKLCCCCCCCFSHHHSISRLILPQRLPWLARMCTKFTTQEIGCKKNYGINY